MAGSDLYSYSADKGKKKLEQLAEYSLFGNIASMKPVRIGNNLRDSLILSFKDAKVYMKNSCENLSCNLKLMD